MEFERLTTEAENLVTKFAAETGIAHEKIRVVASPYRICPLGAHIDHQGGPVLGMTINAYTILAFWFLARRMSFSPPPGTLSVLSNAQKTSISD